MAKYNGKGLKSLKLPLIFDALKGVDLLLDFCTYSGYRFKSRKKWNKEINPHRLT